MATVPNNFVHTTQLAASAATLISTTNAEKKFIGKITLTNTSASSVTCYFLIALTATTLTTGSGGNYNAKVVIPPGTQIDLPELSGQIIGNSMKLSGYASTASVVNILISGVTET